MNPLTLARLATMAKIGRYTFTAVRIADLGLSLSQVADDLWIMIDEDSRYPELKKLTHKMTEVGVIYDENLDMLMNKSNSLTNLSGGTESLSLSMKALYGKGNSIYAHYVALQNQKDTYKEFSQIINKWYEEIWITKNNIQKGLYGKDIEAFNLNLNTNEAYIFMSLNIAGIGVESYLLVKDGHKFYKKIKKNNPQEMEMNILSEVNANEAVNNSKKSCKKIMKWAGKVTHVVLVGASFGMNIYSIVMKAKREKAKEKYLRSEISILEENNKNVMALLEGTKDDKTLLKEVIEYYKLEVSDSGKENLENGISLTLEGVKKSLDSFLMSIFSIYEQLTSSYKVLLNKETELMQALEKDHEEFKQLYKKIQITEKGDIQKEYIMKVVNLVETGLLVYFVAWEKALSKLVELEKINNIVTGSAKSVLCKIRKARLDIDSVDAENMMKDDTMDLLDGLNVSYKSRNIYNTKEELYNFLKHLVQEINTTSYKCPEKPIW